MSKRSLAMWVTLGMALLVSAGCTTPGAISPSTIPLPEEYVELGGQEESSSCGVAILLLPFSNPQPVSEVIEEMIGARGGDALVNVSSDSYSAFFLLGASSCVHVRGTVVKFGK